jgi:hypothetical protein
MRIPEDKRLIDVESELCVLARLRWASRDAVLVRTEIMACFLVAFFVW